jgi:hypothetical protein
MSDALQIFEFKDFGGKIQKIQLLAISFWLLAFRAFSFRGILRIPPACAP